jgi:hypothetical protein
MALCREFRPESGGNVAGANYRNGVCIDRQWCQQTGDNYQYATTKNALW